MSNAKDALQSLEHLIDFIRSQNYSSHYYSTVYHRPTFQSDLAPYIITGGITPEIQASLEEYRDYARRVGDDEKEFVVTQLLKRETTR